MMKRTVTFVFVLVACFFAATLLQAATYTVDDDDTSADFSNIQDAIDSAALVQLNRHLVTI